ncbi:ATP synthase mitochondrial F1 complex assembly factor 1 [Folsomia candida]|uniref:ATP synthase mitochondrial F1 complex assembly factor 1 n=1 Tax=Folsomia candida TaxID=158441 RepID=A0A226E3S2_FOLCA|nr:ATP synthase mitochondrial F1 complex assembly factor 1 [Folsomia candida]
MIPNPVKNGIMIHRNNLAKLFSPSSRGELLTPTGGTVTHAYFHYQHLHHRQNSAGTRNSLQTFCCSRQLHVPSGPFNNSGTEQTSDRERSNNQASNSSSSSQNAEIKSKLEALKEKLSENAYFEKYKDKFQQMELTSPRELLAKLEQLDSKISGGSNKGQPNKQVGKQAFPQSRSTDHFLLNDVMELSRIKDLDRDDIIFFLLPLPREHGYEFLFVQFMNNAFHFTPLIAYQTHKENAPECLRLIQYTDLQSSKDLVLMRGEFDKNLMSTKDAHILAVQVNFYYGETSDSRKNLLESFFRKPDSFQHMDLIDELKKLQETHPHLFEFEE